MPQKQPIVVFSHLRWDFVYQRPQHLLSRLAEDRKIIFIEEPEYTEGRPGWKKQIDQSGVTAYRPQTNRRSFGFSDEQIAAIVPMLPSLLEEQELHPYSYVVWLYTAMALPAAQALQPSAVVYDCMDELSLFKGAPQELVEREARLLQWADIVFTGGPSLYRAKQGKHRNLYCFPSSVDVDHFRSASAENEPADQANLSHPRLGFYGVIDERLDLDIIAGMSEAHPEWQIVLVGPVVKIDPQTLPRSANIHYTGQRDYNDLPGYLAGWDVCLLPFARNESTRFISPTKTLEYMAVELPIVSTPITDVAEPYSDVVYLASTPEEFTAACERALSASPEEREARATRMREVLSRTSWQKTADEMSQLIDEVTAAHTKSGVA